MATFFFYGTLIDADVRAAVLGPGARDIPVADDRLEGWKTVFVQNRTYPVVVRARGATAAGIRAELPGDDARERLIGFEGPQYRIARLALASGNTAEVFVRSDICRATPRPWTFDDWKRRHKREFLARIRGAD